MIGIVIVQKTLLVMNNSTSHLGTLEKLKDPKGLICDDFWGFAYHTDIFI